LVSNYCAVVGINTVKNYLTARNRDNIKYVIYVFLTISKTDIQGVSCAM
jgi:hypothetical protein